MNPVREMRAEARLHTKEPRSARSMQQCLRVTVSDLPYQHPLKAVEPLLQPLSADVSLGKLLCVLGAKAGIAVRRIWHEFSHGRGFSWEQPGERTMPMSMLALRAKSFDNKRFRFPMLKIFNNFLSHSPTTLCYICSRLLWRQCKHYVCQERPARCRLRFAAPFAAGWVGTSNYQQRRLAEFLEDAFEESRSQDTESPSS